MNTVREEAKSELVELQAYKPKPIIGPDEERLLDALKKTVPAGNPNEAPYKIEVMFGSGRTPSGPNNCIITIWETGRLKGSAEEIMHWCGYDDCRMPIRGGHMAQFHVVCPNCQRESFVDPDAKIQLTRLAKKERMDYRRMEMLPVITGEYYMNRAPTKLVAQRVSEMWRKLGTLADLWIKYSPKDIRGYDLSDVKQGDNFDTARIMRNEKAKALRYTMNSIHRDLASGATLEGRFLAALAA